MSPTELAIYLSRGKAADVAAKNPGSIVIGADSFAELNGKLLGKPHTLEKGRHMLHLLSGQTHNFVTGFTIVDSDSSKEYSEAVITKVTFRKLTDEEIDAYLAKENILENAGAYIIQGLGGVLIEKIEGDYFNVVGLPLASVAVALKGFGISII